MDRQDNKKRNNSPLGRKLLRSRLAYMVVFVLCFAYWGYLFNNSQMEIKFDAIGYEELGFLIHEQGWQEFFRTGPNREPLYPALIAFSMKIAGNLSVPYQQVQKIFQIMILFVTQLLMIKILSQAKVRQSIIAAIILYFGFSPAIVNSAFSLYSEIVVFPFVLAVVYLGSVSWRDIHCHTVGRVAGSAVLTSIAFVFAIFGKGIFQYVFIFFLFPYVYSGFHSAIKGDRRIFKNILIYILVSVFIVGMSVTSYRFLNKKYNGSFEFTTRYDYLLFGNAAKRVEKLNKDLIIAHVLSIPGGGVCRSVYPTEICEYTEFHYADKFRVTMLPELLKGTSNEEIPRKTIQLTLSKIIRNPVQYAALSMLESFKMGFWESTQIGNVIYPKPLKKLFDATLFKNGIRLLVSLATYISLIFLITYVYRNRSNIRTFNSDDNEKIRMGFFVIWFIMPFTGLHALFSILTRFALPIASLYLLCIAFTIQHIFVESLHHVSIDGSKT